MSCIQRPEEQVGELFSAFSAVFGLIVLWILFGSERSDEFFAH